MAKRHKEEEPEEEGYDFIPPEFDEDEFIHKEMVSFHTTTVLFLAGIVAAIVSWLLFGVLDAAKTGWLVGLLIAAATFGALKPLFRALKIDISHWGRREMLGTGFLLFFTWLAFFIMFINPPISDFADPEVDVFIGPSAAAIGDDVVMDFFFTDNGKVTDWQAKINGAVVELEHLGGAHHRYILEDAPAGIHTWSAWAKDSKGRTTTANGTIEVVPDVVEVTIGDLTSREGTLFVEIPDALNVWAVYADIEGGDRVYLKFEEEFGGYRATSNFLGWKEGTNNFTIVVEEKNRFHGQTLVPGGVLVDGPHVAQVSDPGDYDKGLPKKANPTKAPVRNVPGFEVPLLIAGLVGLAFVARRK